MRPAGATRDATRQRLMTVAAELFARNGFASTGIRDIASAAHLSSSSLYEYMCTKDDLLVEIMERTIEPLIRAGRAAAAAAESPEWLLAAMTENHVWFHATHPHQTMVSDTELRVLGGERRDRVIAQRDAYEQLWRSAVAAGVAAGVFDVIDVEVAARSLISLCTGIGVWYRPGGRLDIERLCAAHADLALAAVRARRDGRLVHRASLELADPGQMVDLSQ